MILAHAFQTFKQRKLDIFDGRKTSQNEVSFDNQRDADIADLRVIFQYIEDIESNLTIARGYIEPRKKAFQEMEESVRFELEMESGIQGGNRRSAWAGRKDSTSRTSGQGRRAVRRRLIEQAKIFWSQNNPSSDEPDQSAIAVGNEATHGGNVLVNAAKFELQLLDIDQYQRHFQRLYDIPWYDCLLPPPWNPSTLAMRNIYGTMASYGAFNNSSMSNGMDLRFSLL